MTVVVRENRAREQHMDVEFHTPVRTGAVHTDKLLKNQH